MLGSKSSKKIGVFKVSYTPVILDPHSFEPIRTIVIRWSPGELSKLGFDKRDDIDDMLSSIRDVLIDNKMEIRSASPTNNRFETEEEIIL